jgi:hypothetical protein
MSAAGTGSSLRFPENFKPDTGFFDEAMAVFLRQSGYVPGFSFADLTLSEQSVVLRLAQKLKQEAER